MNANRLEILLGRTFFRRLFESDLMPPGLPQTQLVIWGIALLAAPGHILSFVAGLQYDQLSRTNPASLPGRMLLDELVFVSFAMMAMGFVALIVWEGVFPDKRDARILGVLPLPVRTHVIARLGALFGVAILLCAGATVPSALVYGPIIAAHGGAAGLIRGVAAHAIATSMGGIFIFFLVIAAQGVLLNIAGRRLAQRLAIVLQTALVILFLQTLLFIPLLRSLVASAFRDSDPSEVAWLAPVWFLSLYDAVAGTPRAIPTVYAVAAVASTLALVLFSVVMLAASYRRLVRVALETTERHATVRSTRGGFVADAVARVITPNQMQRAVTGFTLKTVMRSRMHLMLLAMYVGVAAAIVLTTLIPLFVTGGREMFSRPSVAVLSAPLVLNFFALCGMRVMFGIPTVIKANWVFRLHTSPSGIIAAVSGVRTALLIGVVMPIALIAGVVAALLWDVKTGTLHAVFTGALGVLLSDILLIGVRKIPFTCTYYPGRSRARTLWPIYGILFSTYAYSFAAVEVVLLHSTLAVALTVVAIGLVSAVFAFFRKRALQPPATFVYEEEDPDRVFGGFRLSEGLASESPVSRRRSLL